MLRRAASCLLVILGCSAVDEADTSTEQALRKVEGFCQRWAEFACNDTVVQRCSAASADACIASQSSFCREIVPDGRYSDVYAQQCLNAVKEAFRDGELSTDERNVVRTLSSPCDRVLSGDGGDGDPCLETPDCNTVADLSCVRLPGADFGTCREPLEVGGGHDCSPDDTVCEPGFYCDGHNCLAEKKDGMPCNPQVPCRAEFQCQRPDGSRPVPELDDARCVAKAGVGSECEKDADCLSDICSKAGPALGVCSALVVLSPTDPICEKLR
jgi:hypothetical protein